MAQTIKAQTNSNNEYVRSSNGADDDKERGTTERPLLFFVGMSLRQAQRHETYFPILDNNFLG